MKKCQHNSNLICLHVRSAMQSVGTRCPAVMLQGPCTNYGLVGKEGEDWEDYNFIAFPVHFFVSVVLP